MPRELPTYRANLERMDELFPGRELLTPKDLMILTGACYNTTRKLFPFEGTYISKVNVAHRLSQIGRMPEA